jgi:hypothetical protein
VLVNLLRNGVFMLSTNSFHEPPRFVSSLVSSPYILAVLGHCKAEQMRCLASSCFRSHFVISQKFQQGEKSFTT